MSAPVFSRTTVLAVADEIAPLLEMHYQEVALHKDVVKLDPDWARYCAMEERGDCHVYAVRDFGALIGYAVFFTHNHIHYQKVKIAQNDLLFLSPCYRRGTLAVRFMKFCEQELKKLRVNKITWHVKKHNDWSAVLHRMGYETEETILGKIL